MHEQAIAQSIIKQAEKQGKVKKIVVEVGELAHLPAADLQKALNAVAGFKSVVKETPAVVQCPCGFKGRPKIELHSHDATIYFCQKCGKVPKIVNGDKIVIKSVDVE
jgi:Zn finger protein HypA/HybF involved in hydrogenase expression